MTHAGLTPDVPLGPFEGTPLTAFAAAGRTTRLHASLACNRLRTDTPRELRVSLDASTIGRMCTECASWGQWARPGTALGLFLKEFRGVGMAYELEACLGPDPDDPGPTPREITEAAAVLRRGEPSSDDDDDYDEAAWAAYSEARELRDSVLVPAWSHAATSLLEAANRAARYSWLSSWAAKRLEQKAEYTETLRRHAAALISEEALITAALIDREDEPDLPVSDPAFAVLGGQAAVCSALSGLRREWRSRVRTGHELPGYYPYLGYDLMGGKRKGRELVNARKNAMLDAWAGKLQSDVAPALQAPRRLVLATVPAGTDADGQRWSIERTLGFWDIGVLLTYTRAVHWSSRTFLLSTPAVVAERLLRDWSSLEAREWQGDPDDTQSPESILRSAVAANAGENGSGAYLPGTLDDTPIAQRRIASLAEIRVLRERLDHTSQLFVVCSATNGVEVLSLARLERRCKDGWSGILLAEAGDLPDAMIAPLIADSAPFEPETGGAPADKDNDEDRYERWRTGGREPSDPDFGDHLGIEAAAAEFERFHRRPGARWKADRALRTMALISGVSDLRSIEDEYTDPGQQAVPHAVWDSLLLPRARVNLLPFRPRDDDWPYRCGLGLPLGVLADIQVYAKNADLRTMGKGHAPFCQHDQGQTLDSHYDLMTLADAMQFPEEEWCSKCGGYALRRFSRLQVAYYRAAHVLLNVAESLDQELRGHGGRRLDLDAITEWLAEVSPWGRSYAGPLNADDAETVATVIRDLKAKAQTINRYRQDGWPDAGTVIELRPLKLPLRPY
jgi:hypothetical protein